MRISVLDRNSLLHPSIKNAFEDRTRLGLGRYASQIAHVVLQVGVSSIPRVARTQPLLLIAYLRNEESVIVSGELDDDGAALSVSADRLCRAVSLKLRGHRVSLEH